MNRQIRQLAGGLMVCYVALFVALNYWQIGRQEALNARFDNTRAVRRDFDQPRGPIVTADGVVVAQSVASTPGSQFEFVRQYPTRELFANVTGYYTFAFGATQLERTQNDILAGDTAQQQLLGLPNLITGDDNTGSVRLTMDHRLQRVARDALGEREGSVVVVEPRTGAIKAMWSYPSYDPNLVTTEDFDLARDILTYIGADPRDPLLANAYQQRYMPGSTFKVLTTGIGFENRVIDLSSTFPEESSFLPPQTTDPIGNYGGSTCGGDMAQVFARSCNIPFAKTALAIGPELMVEGTKAWGLEQPVPIDLPRPATSTFGDTSDLGDNLPLLAIRGFGQNDVQMVPLHMALVAAAVGNGGRMMSPYVVDATLDHSGRVLDRTDPSVWMTPISPQTALIENSLMQGVATTGTASCCIGLAAGSPWPPRPARPSSTTPASRSNRTRGSSPSRRPTTRSSPSP